MSLNLTQELQLLKDGEKPGEGIGPGTNAISELVYQSAIGTGIDFLATAKNVDDGTNPDASLYLSKILAVIRNVMRKDLQTLDTMRKVFVGIIGDSAFTFAQVQGANEDKYISLLNGGLIAGIDTLKIFEVVSGVLPHEKSDYDSL